VKSAPSKPTPRVVASLLAAAVAAHVKGRLAAQLQTALDRRMLIEQAKGILMAKEGIDAAVAFECLRTAARSTRRRVVDVAHDLIPGRPPPQPQPPPQVRRARRDHVAQEPASMGGARCRRRSQRPAETVSRRPTEPARCTRRPSALRGQ